MIRNYQKEDIGILMNIWLQGNIDAHYFIEKNYWQDHYDEVKRELPNARLYVDEEDGKIAGFVGMQGEYIAGIFVKRAYRVQGIGSKLIDFLKLKHNRLQLSVYKQNQTAFNFYQKRGFKVIKKEIDNETGAWECRMEWKK
ncbi:N-acetyltransferase [Lactobacillus acidophilus]